MRQLTLRSAWNYRLFLERPEWFNYTTPGHVRHAGQAQPGDGAHCRRAYSIVSAPHEDFLEFYIALTVENVNELPELHEDDPEQRDADSRSTPTSRCSSRTSSSGRGRRPAAEQRAPGPGNAGQLPLRHHGSSRRRLWFHGHRRRGGRADCSRASLVACSPQRDSPARRAQPRRLRLPGRVQGAPPPVPVVPVPHVPQP